MEYILIIILAVAVNGYFLYDYLKGNKDVCEEAFTDRDLNDLSKLDDIGTSSKRDVVAPAGTNIGMGRYYSKTIDDATTDNSVSVETVLNILTLLQEVLEDNEVEDIFKHNEMALILKDKDLNILDVISNVSPIMLTSIFTHPDYVNIDTLNNSISLIQEKVKSNTVPYTMVSKYKTKGN